MSKTDYIKKVNTLREINIKICKIEKILETDLTSGPFGQLFDFIYDLMIPEGSPDEAYERFGDLIFDNASIDDEDIGEFYDSLFEE